MNPDLQRLCEAAKSAEEAGGSGSRYEAIVRAVLTALREPSSEMIEAGNREQDEYDAFGRAECHTADVTFTVMIDRILAEPAKT